MLAIKMGIAARVRQRRKEQKLSQKKLAETSRVSLGSIKRFERKGEISLKSLLKISFALGYEHGFVELFDKKPLSLNEVVSEYNELKSELLQRAEQRKK
jgi:transcriptional regulator with XRE-family HTH domain